MVFGVILGIVLGVLFIGSLVYSIYSFVDTYEKDSDKKRGFIFLALFLVFLVLFICIPFSFHTVDTGEVAVVKHLGAVKEVKTPGMYYTFWMTNSYTYYDTKVQNVDIETAAYSSDAQTMTLQIFFIR